MIKLQNSHLIVAIDESCGCDVLSVARANEKGDAQRNLLSARGWQTWLKRGEETDFATGGLSAFYPGSRAAKYSVKQRSDALLIAAWQGEKIAIEKTVRLENTRLSVEVRVLQAECGESESLQDEFFRSEVLQVEHFILVAGGALADRSHHLTRVVGASYEHEITLEPFSQRYVLAWPFEDTRIEVWDDTAGVEFTASPNTDAVACVSFGKVQARGGLSYQFTLARGEAFTHRMEMELLPVSNRARAAVSRRSNTQYNTAAMLEMLQGEPAFEGRWSHLCLQYDRVEVADVRKIISQMLVPLRYNGVIFEVDRGVRFDSHPELAESWSLSISQMRALVACCRDAGLQVGLQFNTPGHQNETNLLKAHPDFAEDAAIWDRPPLCVSHSGARRVVGEVVGELVETFRPDLFFWGADEVQFAGNNDTIFARCERCRGIEPAQLFGEYLQWLCGLLPENMTSLIFGDMFLRADQFGPATGGNGSGGDLWRALEYLPPHVQIADWHYYPRGEYPTLDFFQNAGHRVWPTVAFDFDGIAQFARYAQERGVKRILHTTWAVPNQEKLPVESMVWAAFYFCLGWRADALPVREMALEFCRDFWE